MDLGDRRCGHRRAVEGAKTSRSGRPRSASTTARRPRRARRDPVPQVGTRRPARRGGSPRRRDDLAELDVDGPSRSKAWRSRREMPSRDSGPAPPALMGRPQPATAPPSSTRSSWPAGGRAGVGAGGRGPGPGSWPGPSPRTARPATELVGTDLPRPVRREGEEGLGHGTATRLGEACRAGSQPVDCPDGRLPGQAAPRRRPAPPARRRARWGHPRRRRPGNSCSSTSASGSSGGWGWPRRGSGSSGASCSWRSASGATSSGPSLGVTAHLRSIPTARRSRPAGGARPALPWAPGPGGRGSGGRADGMGLFDGTGVPGAAGLGGAFCREEVEPLELVFPYAVRIRDPEDAGPGRPLAPAGEGAGAVGHLPGRGTGWARVRPAEAGPAQRDHRPLRHRPRRSSVARPPTPATWRSWPPTAPRTRRSAGSAAHEPGDLVGLLDDRAPGWLGPEPVHDPRGPRR